MAAVFLVQSCGYWVWRRSTTEQCQHQSFTWSIWGVSETLCNKSSIKLQTFWFQNRRLSPFLVANIGQSWRFMIPARHLIIQMQPYLEAQRWAVIAKHLFQFDIILSGTLSSHEEWFKMSGKLRQMGTLQSGQYQVMINISQILEPDKPGVRSQICHWMCILWLQSTWSHFSHLSSGSNNNTYLLRFNED